jgi:hypothetical protein
MENQLAIDRCVLKETLALSVEARVQLVAILAESLETNPSDEFKALLRELENN